jgi:hypothetical protein
MGGRKMEGGQSSDRATASEAYKADIYETIEAFLVDREMRRFLCGIEGGIYRDGMVAALKRLLRPITMDDVLNMIYNMIQLRMFEVEFRTLPTALPKELLLVRRKVRSRKNGEERVIEELKPPKGFEIEGIYGDTVILRSKKLFLKPTKELQAVCRVLESRG